MRTNAKFDIIMDMKSANIIIIAALTLFLISQLDFCSIAHADNDGDHCSGCCSLGCHQVIIPTNLTNDSAAVFKIFYSQNCLPQSSLTKGLDRPPKAFNS